MLLQGPAMLPTAASTTGPCTVIRNWRTLRNLGSQTCATAKVTSIASSKKNRVLVDADTVICRAAVRASQNQQCLPTTSARVRAAGLVLCEEEDGITDLHGGGVVDLVDAVTGSSAAAQEVRKDLESNLEDLGPGGRGRHALLKQKASLSTTRQCGQPDNYRAGNE